MYENCLYEMYYLRLKELEPQNRGGQEILVA